MAKVYPPTKTGSRANITKRTPGSPQDLGPRGASGKAGTRARSTPKTAASPNTSATGRGDYQGPHGKAVAGAAVNIAKSGKAADEMDRRMAFSRATGKKLDS